MPMDEVRAAKRRRTTTVVTLGAVRAAVAWPALEARPLDYLGALESVPRGRVATCREVASLAGGHGTMGENIACARAIRGAPLAHRVVKAGARVSGAAADALAHEGVDLAAPRHVSLARCRAERVIVPEGAAGETTLVYLHGRGGFPSTYAGRHSQWWSRGRLGTLGRVVCPGGEPRDAARTAWVSYEADDWTPTRASLAAARKRVAAVLRREIDRCENAVVVAAYSEGVVAALDAALATPGVAGFVGINGTAPPPDAAHAAPPFPVVLLNGSADATMPASRVVADVAALGRPVDHVLVDGAPHGLGDDEGRLLDFGLRRLLGSGGA